MRTTTLGNTNLVVSAIGFGAMHFSLAGRPPEAQSLDVLHHVLDLGVTFIDTADAYCRDEADKHHNERIVHKALATYPGDASRVVVATKRDAPVYELVHAAAVVEAPRTLQSLVEYRLRLLTADVVAMSVAADLLIEIAKLSL